MMKVEKLNKSTKKTVCGEISSNRRTQTWVFKEEVNVRDGIGRDFEISVEEKLQEEESRETAEPANVISIEKQEERNTLLD